MKKISGGYAKAGQLALLLFFTPLVLLLSYVVITKNFTLNGLVFLLFVLFIIGLILYISFSYADIYVSDDFIIIKKLFSVKKKSITEIQEIDKGIIPLAYFIKFNNNLKVLFTLQSSEIFEQFLSSDSNKGLNILKSKLLKDNENPNIEHSE
jgi:hypothetical protein